MTSYSSGRGRLLSLAVPAGFLVALLFLGIYSFRQADPVSSDECGDGPHSGAHRDLDANECGDGTHEAEGIHTRVVSQPLYSDFEVMDARLHFDARGLPDPASLRPGGSLRRPPPTVSEVPAPGGPLRWEPVIFGPHLMGGDLKVHVPGAVGDDEHSAHSYNWFRCASSGDDCVSLDHSGRSYRVRSPVIASDTLKARVNFSSVEGSATLTEQDYYCFGEDEPVRTTGDFFVGGFLFGWMAKCSSHGVISDVTLSVSPDFDWNSELLSGLSVPQVMWEVCDGDSSPPPLRCYPHPEDGWEACDDDSNPPPRRCDPGHPPPGWNRSMCPSVGDIGESCILAIEGPPFGVLPEVSVSVTFTGSVDSESTWPIVRESYAGLPRNSDGAVTVSPLPGRFFPDMGPYPLDGSIDVWVDDLLSPSSASRHHMENSLVKFPSAYLQGTEPLLVGFAHVDLGDSWDLDEEFVYRFGSVPRRSALAAYVYPLPRGDVTVCLPLSDYHSSNSEDLVFVSYRNNLWGELGSAQLDGGLFCGAVPPETPVALAVKEPVEETEIKAGVRLEFGFSAPGAPVKDLQFLRRAMMEEQFRVRDPVKDRLYEVGKPNVQYIAVRGGFLSGSGSDSGWYRPADATLRCGGADDKGVCTLELLDFSFAPDPDRPDDPDDPDDTDDPGDEENGSRCPFAKPPTRDRGGIVGPGDPTGGLSEEERLTVRIQPCAGIRAPKVSLGDPEHSPYSWTVRGSASYPVDGDDPASFLPANGKFRKFHTENLLRVVTPVSSARGGASVKVSLHFPGSLQGGSNIEVDFGGTGEFGRILPDGQKPDFVLPESFSSGDVTLFTYVPGTGPDSGGDSGNLLTSFVNSSVTLDSDRRMVTIQLPRNFRHHGVDAWHTLEFRVGVGESDGRRIHNSNVSGFKEILLRYSDSVYGPGVQREPYRAYVYRVEPQLFLTPRSGFRGSSFELSGENFPDGSLTVREAVALPGSCAPKFGAEIITDAATDDYGNFSVDVDAGGEPGGGDFRISVEDSLGGFRCLVFRVEPFLKVNPKSIPIGGDFTVTLSDLDLGAVYVALRPGTPGDWAASRVLVDCIGNRRLPAGGGPPEFTMPAGPPPGPAYIEVYSKGTLLPPGSSGCVADGSKYDARAEIEIGAIPLEINISKAVPGQRVVVSVRGFSQSPDVSKPDVASVTVAGKAIELPESARRVSPGGLFEAAFDLPLSLSASAGKDIEVVAVSHSGARASGKLSILEPLLSIDPESGLLGSSVDIEFSGFFSDRLLQFDYGRGCSGSPSAASFMGTAGSSADGSGEVSLPLPSAYPGGVLPTDNIVVSGTSRPSDVSPLCAEAGHDVPVPVISVFPLVAAPGGRLTVAGENFVPHTGIDSVFIGGEAATITGSPRADAGGSFRFAVTVPNVPPGQHPVRVVQGNDVAVWTVTIVRPGPRGSPDEVFSGLGGIVSVWKPPGGSAGGGWLFWFPNLRDESGRDLSTLRNLNGGDGVWVRLSSGGTYAGVSYSAGWHWIYVL